jgi:zinc/manganese transport system substrate-binding protein
VVGRAGSLIAVFALAVAVTGCSSTTDIPPGALSIVASTNVWGDIATQVAGRLIGRKVVVRSFIDNPSTDPHSFEASTRDELAIAHADLILENGGGYDDFMETLRSSVGRSAHIINAVDVSGKHAVDGSLNEHVWYDLHTVAVVAARIAQFLAEHDRANAATYRANERQLAGHISVLRGIEQRLKQEHGGEGIAITEPVPLYMVDACGLANRTPPQFSKAVEDGTDVSPRVLQQTLALFTRHEVDALVYNAQTTGPQTDQVESAATASDVPTVPVTETLPAGKTYYSWMRGQLDVLAAALG